MSRAIRIVLAVVIGLAAVAGWNTSAWAADTATTATVTASLTSAGTLTVTETFNFSAAPVDVSALTQQIPNYLDNNGLRYSYTISDISATADDSTVQPTVTKKSQVTTVSIPVGTATKFVLTYTVAGTTVAAAGDKVSFSWPLVYGLNVDVTWLTGTVELPPGAINYSCTAGEPGALVTCGTYSAGTHGDATLTFTNYGLQSGELLRTDVMFPAGLVTVTEHVEPVWTLGYAFYGGAAQIGVMAAVLVVGGLALFFVWRRVRTAGYKGQPVAVAGFAAAEGGQVRFSVDPAARPGMIGTLVDSRVDPADILATILDLAVRGHLRITELKTSQYGASDWAFTRLSVADELKPYELQLLDALTTSEVKVSALSKSVGPVIARVQDAISHEVVSVGWFSRLPSKRSPMVLWTWAAVAVAAIVTGVLVAATSFGLAGLALIAVAIVGLVIAYQTHPVTQKGAAVFAGLDELSKQLHTHTGSEIAAADRYTQISQILPYAVVLGSWEHWVEALAQADGDPDPDPTDLDWYHAPPDWRMSDLPHSLDSFITIVTGRLFTRS